MFPRIMYSGVNFKIVEEASTELVERRRFSMLLEMAGLVHSQSVIVSDRTPFGRTRQYEKELETKRHRETFSFGSALNENETTAKEDFECESQIVKPALRRERRLS